MTDKEKILAFLEGMSKGCCPKETKEIIINKIIPWINDLPKEPVSEEQVKESLISKHEDKTCKENGNSLTQELVNKDFEMALAEMIDKAQKCVVEPLVVAEQWKDELIKLAKSEEPVNEDFKIALEKKVREAQDWTYIEEEGCECPLSEEFGAYDLEEFARWGANWQKEQMMKEAKSGIGNNDNFIQFEDGTWIDLDPSMQLNPAFDIVEGVKAKVIVIKEE